LDERDILWKNLKNDDRLRDFYSIDNDFGQTEINLIDN